MTQVIIRHRAGGKTTEMLRWMAAQRVGERRVCVTFSEMEAARLRHLARDLELDIEHWQFTSISEVARGTLYGRGNNLTIGVDNAELVLAAIAGNPVDVISVTGFVEDVL